MQFKVVSILSTVIFIITACNNQQSPKTVNEQSTVSSMDSVAEATISEQFKNVVFDAKKDLVCGMPTNAGVSDTAHYKNKVYGFCSKECKGEFIKNPPAYLTVK